VSNTGHDSWVEHSVDRIILEIDEIPELKKMRPDLMDDLQEFVLEEMLNYVELDEPPIKDLIIMFLVSISHYAMSNKDLNNMENEYEYERKAPWNA